MGVQPWKRKHLLVYSPKSNKLVILECELCGPFLRDEKGRRDFTDTIRWLRRNRDAIIIDEWIVEV